MNADEMLDHLKNKLGSLGQVQPFFDSDFNNLSIFTYPTWSESRCPQ